MNTIRTRHRWVSAIVAGLLLVGAIAAAPGITAQDDGAAPVVTTPDDGADPGTEPLLDLAAITLQPADVGVPGYRLGDSYTEGLERWAAFANEYRGGDAEGEDAWRERLEDAGFRRSYTNRLGLVAENDPNVYRSEILSYVLEYATADGASDGFTLLEDEAGIAGTGDVPGRAAGGFGEEWELTRIADEFDDGTPYFALDLTFRRDRFVAGVTVVDYAGDRPAVATVESLAITLELHLSNALSGFAPAPGLGNRIARYSGDAVVTFSDRYEDLNGVAIPRAGETEAETLDRQTYDADIGADAVYYLYQSIALDPDDQDASAGYAQTLYRFTGRREATVWAKDAAAFFVANPGVYLDVRLVEDAAEVGDGSATLAYGYQRADGTRADGYFVYLYVGKDVAALQLDAPGGVPLAVVEDLAAAQGACLQDGACPDPLPAPDLPAPGAAASPVASPVASPAATPAASPRSNVVVINPNGGDNRPTPEATATA